jgi:replicative DNA helicase
MMNRAMLAEEEPGEILAGAEETLLKLGDSRVKSGLINPAQILQEYEGGISAFLDPSKRIKGISTGFAKLDEMTGGLHGGELVIIAARPSMGKTALALNIASTSPPPQEDRRHFLARNVRRVAPHPYALRGRPCR